MRRGHGLACCSIKAEEAEHDYPGRPRARSGKEPACQCRRRRFDPWLKIPHSSVLAWKIPWTEGPGGLQPMGVSSQWDATEHVLAGFHAGPAEHLPCFPLRARMPLLGGGLAHTRGNRTSLDLLVRASAPAVEPDPTPRGQ